MWSSAFLAFLLSFFPLVLSLLTYTQWQSGMAAMEGGQVLRPNYTCSSFVLSWLELPVGGEGRGRRLRVGGKEEGRGGSEGGREEGAKGKSWGIGRTNNERGVDVEGRSDRRTMHEERKERVGENKEGTRKARGIHTAP